MNGAGAGRLGVAPGPLWRQFTGHWRPFLAVHLAVAALSFTLLTPAVAALLNLAVRLSGDAALSDLDILFFVLSPGGFAAFLLLGSLFAILLFLEHAAMLVVALTVRLGQPANARQALVFLLRRAPAVFELTLRVLLRVLLNLLPFALLLLLVYRRYLGEYDINYYLAEKPPEWRLALGLGALIAALCAANLLRLFVNWLLCLPLLLFTGCAPRQALAQSRATVRGHRRALLGWLLAWLLAALLAGAGASALLGVIGNWVLPRTADSLDALLLGLGLFSFAGFAASLAITLAASAWLSLLIVSVAETLGLRWQRKPDGSPTAPHPLLRGRRLLAAGVVGGLLAALLLSWALTQRLPFTSDSVVMAHRGAAGSSPENTMAAVQAAIDSGAQWVEIDVQETADGRIAVIHDSDLGRVGGSALRVSASTLDALQLVDIGSWFDPRFAGERVPSLEQVLALCKGRIGVNIELKYYGGERRLEQSVAEIVERAGMAEQVRFMSLSHAGIQAMRKLRPDWNVGLLSSVAVGNLAALDVDFLALNGRAATRRLVRHAQEQGKQVFVWTVNDPVAMATMLGRGVDGLITDEPSLAVRVLEHYRALQPHERLLIQLADAFDRPSLYREQ